MECTGGIVNSTTVWHKIVKSHPPYQWLPKHLSVDLSDCRHYFSFLCVALCKALCLTLLIRSCFWSCYILHIFSCLQGEVLDESTLKRLILLFEKRALKNQEMRIKFPDMPEKYVFLYNFILLSWILFLFLNHLVGLFLQKVWLVIWCMRLLFHLITPHRIKLFWTVFKASKKIGEY